MEYSGGNVIENQKQLKLDVKDKAWFPWTDKIVSQTHSSLTGTCFDRFSVLYNRHFDEPPPFHLLSQTVRQPSLVVTNQ